MCVCIYTNQINVLEINNFMDNRQRKTDMWSLNINFSFLFFTGICKHVQKTPGWLWAPGKTGEKWKELHYNLPQPDEGENNLSETGGDSSLTVWWDHYHLSQVFKNFKKGEGFVLFLELLRLNYIFQLDIQASPMTAKTMVAICL